MSVYIILAAILLVAVGGALIQAVNALFVQERCYYHHHYQRDLFVVDIVVILMYLILIGVIAMVYILFGYDPLILYFAVGMLVVLTIAIFVRYLSAHRDTIAPKGLALFLVWFGVVLYLTLFSRLGTKRATQYLITPFEGLMQALAQRSLQPVEHDFLNLLLFVPFGYFIPKINPRCLSRFGFALLGGIVTSTIIEGTQLVTHLGMCDIDDIIANSLGAIVGYGIYCLMRQIRRNWKLE